MEEQVNQDGVLATTWSSRNVRMYRTKRLFLKTCWNYFFSLAGFRKALAEPSVGKPKLGQLLSALEKRHQTRSNTDLFAGGGHVKLYFASPVITIVTPRQPGHNTAQP